MKIRKGFAICFLVVVIALSYMSIFLFADFSEDGHPEYSPEILMNIGTSHAYLRITSAYTYKQIVEIKLAANKAGQNAGAKDIVNELAKAGRSFEYAADRKPDELDHPKLVSRGGRLWEWKSSAVFLVNDHERWTNEVKRNLTVIRIPQDQCVDLFMILARKQQYLKSLGFTGVGDEFGNKFMFDDGADKYLVNAVSVALMACKPNDPSGVSNPMLNNYEVFKKKLVLWGL